VQASFNPSNIMNPNSTPRVHASFNPSNIMNPKSTEHWLHLNLCKASFPVDP